MITIHHCVSARSLRPVWMCEEMGLPYQLHMLPFPPRVQRKDYLAINPLGTVPWLQDGDITLSESAAMCQYLAARYGEGRWDVAAHDPRYGDYLNALHFGEATLTFPQTLLLRYAHFESPERRQPQVVEDYTRWFMGRLKALPLRLQGQPYLCGERFTAADISVGYALLVNTYLDLDQAWPQEVHAYWERLRERPALQRALAREQRDAVAQGVDPTPSPAVRP
ncbi:MAG: glutathione S-transferase family protein [Limnohabitans sp.]|jgi:glutathione S-transferase|nr:glutathione S-transferase family protein [Betaproteobacteria bacterium]